MDSLVCSIVTWVVLCEHVLGLFKRVDINSETIFLIQTKLRKFLYKILIIRIFLKSTSNDDGLIFPTFLLTGLY